MTYTPHGEVGVVEKRTEIGLLSDVDLNPFAPATKPVF